MDLRLDNYKTQSRHAARASGACSILSKWRVVLLFCVFLLPMMLAAAYQYHTVRKGDTLYALSKRYGVTVAQIQKLNSMSGTNLSIGQRLRIKELPKTKPKPPAPPPPAAEPAPAEPPAAPAVEQSASQQGTPVTAPPVELPIDFYHVVKPKDNPFRISQNYGISSKDFFAWNGKSGWDDFDIHPGDKLVIKDPATYVPSGASEEPRPAAGTSGKPAGTDEAVVVSKTYKVRKGDTLYSISKAHGITVDELKTRNNLSSNSIYTGQILYIVGSPGSGASTPSVTLSDLEGTELIRDDLFIPVQGRVTSEFGLRRGRPHKGIDIAAKPGTPIYAVLDGVVVFSGVQRGYGNVIVIEHPDFVMTVYAHNERNLVSLGDEVKKGQQIAELGNTGKSTGPHLHFEYRIKGQAINPRKVLKL